MASTAFLSRKAVFFRKTVTFGVRGRLYIRQKGKFGDNGGQLGTEHIRG
jgi:hypothetical protein